VKTLDVIFELRNVRKVYPMGEERIVALDDITLTFERGKIYCLIGTSGSGKSTLLNLLAGLEKPTRGSIKFLDRYLERLSEKQLALYRQQYIGFVFQSYNLLPTLTALENVTLPLIFRKVSRRKRNKAAYKMLKAVGLGKRWRHKPNELSGGQQQRVSIARAFVNNPQVVFADEPTGNLDTKTTFEMMEMITAMARERNQTLIIVTHDIELSGYADQIINIKDGNVESIVNVSQNKVLGSDIGAGGLDSPESRDSEQISIENEKRREPNELETAKENTNENINSGTDSNNDDADSVGTGR
jgi:putative ABC transport system ATP-binding protein